MGANSGKLAAVPKWQIYLACIGVSGALMIQTGQIKTLWRLLHILQDPGKTAGVVSHLDCPNHGHIDYVFRIEGASFDGREHLIDGISCPELRTGQRVAVYYQRAQPTNNYAFVEGQDDGNSARRAFYTSLAFFGGLAFVGPLLLMPIWGLAVWMRGLLKQF